MLVLLSQTTRVERLSVLMVTHDPDDARAVADHLCLIADGIVSAPTPARATLDDPPPALRAYLGE
jgi:thiamine transport system ATP-binding protein